MMNPNENKTVLQRRVFTQAEIKRLRELRKTLWEEYLRQVTVAHRRLEFMRWLVQTKRITD
ncbi:MAG TPA: hypothetical protein VFV38_32555 [Ktedonobacteraceae bacterium]|nr:hypothetical protein [Ktedonobacteraceae bacterium]